MSFDRFHLGIPLPFELLDLGVEPPLREPLPAGELLHGLHRRLRIGIARCLHLLDLFLKLAHLRLHRVVGAALRLVKLGDELLPLGIGLLAGGGHGVFNPLERAVLRLPLADLEEPVVTRQRVENVEHERDVVKVEAKHLVGPVAEAEDPTIHQVDVGDDDGTDRLRYRPAILACFLAALRPRLPLDCHGQHHRLLCLLFEDLQLPHVAAVAHHLLDLDRPGAQARLGQRGPGHVGLVVLDDGSRKRKQHLLEASRDRLAGIEAGQLAGGVGGEIGVDEDKLIRQFELGMRVVILADDERIGTSLPHGRSAASRHELQAERLPELTDVALGLLLRLKHRHRPARPAAGLRRARHALHQHRQRILEHSDRLARADGGHEVVHLLRAQRRRLHGEQHVVAVGDRR